jgi:predicted nucleic acid-binding protein
MIFLDASAIIYLIEGDQVVQQAVQKTLASLIADQPEAGLVISALSLLECRIHPLREGRQDRLDRFDRFFNDPGLVTVDLNRSIIETATYLRANHGLRTPDALQAACCLEIDPKMPFVTGDKDFKKVTTLNIHPIE